MNSRAVGNAVTGTFGCIGVYIFTYRQDKAAQTTSLGLEDGLVNAMSGKGSGSYHMEKG